jgi:RNA-directed DNA polymerase
MEFRPKPTTALEAACRQRPYVHFDLPFKKGEIDKIEALVANPRAVCKHAFYPFLRIDLVRNKVKRAQDGRKKFSCKIREIRYAAHKDSAIYAYYNFLISEKYEKRIIELGIDREVIAFRSLGKSNIEFAAEAFGWIKDNTPCVALGFDVRDFFGTIDHALLKMQWADILGVDVLPDDHYSVFRAITKHASVDLIEARRKLGISRSKLEKSKRICSSTEFRRIIHSGGLISVNREKFGIPQGSPISALLSNLYLLPFDEKIKSHVDVWNGLYRRYCDDILIVVPVAHKEEACARVKELLEG